MENMIRRGVDVLIAVDTSLSMNTPDAPPNRIGKAKQELQALLAEMGDARVGIISFAGSAFLQCPLTVDRSAAAMFLELMETGLISDPGTDIGSAIRLARDTFQRHQQKYKVLILLTDGENLTGDPLAEAQRAAEEGVVIFTIGVGTPEGQPIPVFNERNEVVDYKREADGTPVISRLDESALAAIARVGNADYFRASVLEDEVAVLAVRIDGMEKKDLQSQMTRRFVDRYQVPLLSAVVCLIVAGMLSDGRRSMRRLADETARWWVLVWRRAGRGSKPRTQAVGPLGVTRSGVSNGGTG